MDSLTVTVLLLASLLHASWHALVKSGEDQIAVLAGMGLVASVAAGLALPFLPFPDARAWPVLAVSIGLHVGYKLCLSSAYARGDLGLAFPLARGLVPVFATGFAFFTLGQVPGLYQVGAILLVSAGALVLATERIGNRLNWRLIAATAGAGAAVAAYSVLDAHGTRIARTWAGFTAWLIVGDTLVFLVTARAMSGAGLWPALLRMRGRIAVSGLLGLLSFAAFLWALSRNAVGPVTALRESSLLFAIVIGMARYGETGSVRRIGAALAIFAGIALIAAR